MRLLWLLSVLLPLPLLPPPRRSHSLEAAPAPSGARRSDGAPVKGQVQVKDKTSTSTTSAKLGRATDGPVGTASQRVIPMARPLPLSLAKPQLP